MFFRRAEMLGNVEGLGANVGIFWGVSYVPRVVSEGGSINPSFFEPGQYKQFSLCHFVKKGRDTSHA